MKILYVRLVSKGSYTNEQLVNEMKPYLGPNTLLDVTQPSGDLPEAVDYLYRTAMVVPLMLNVVEMASTLGYEAIITGCFGDPGLHESREIVEIPVIGPGEASMLLACTLGHKFSIITVEKIIPQLERNVLLYGLANRVASIRSIETAVVDLNKEKEKTKLALLNESKKAIDENRAEVIVLGCTGMIGVADFLQSKLRVPVIDPVITAIKFAEMLISLKDSTGISHSKIKAYLTPPEKSKTSTDSP